MTETTAGAVERAADALRAVDPQESVNLEDLYRIGEYLSKITDALRNRVLFGLSLSIERLRSEPVYDDTEGDETFRRARGVVDPQDRLDEAIGELKALSERLDSADDAAGFYHEAIGHIGIRGTS